MRQKGNRYSPQLQFQVVIDVLKGDRDAVEIARAHDLHPTTVARWKREFPESGAEAAYEKNHKEMGRLLGRKEVEIALLRNFMDGSS